MAPDPSSVMQPERTGARTRTGVGQVVGGYERCKVGAVGFGSPCFEIGEGPQGVVDAAIRNKLVEGWMRKN